MLLLGIDLETTGQASDGAEILEVGAILWDSVAQSPIEMRSALLPVATVPASITDLTGITQTMTEKAIASFEWLATMADKAKYLVAHNASFEQGFLNELLPDPIYAWLDTMTDIPYKPGKGKGTLSEIAMNHGVFNPMPHRALTDTLCMLQVLAQYDLAEVIKLSQIEPRRVHLSFGYDETKQKNELCKQRGYRWHPDSKTWFKEIRSLEADAEIDAERAFIAEQGFRLVTIK